MYLEALHRRPRHQLGELGFFGIGRKLKKAAKKLDPKKVATGLYDKVKSPLKKVGSMIPGVGDAIMAYDVKKLSKKEAAELAKMTQAEQDAFLARKAEIEQRNRNLAILGIVGVGVAGLFYAARRK